MADDINHAADNNTIPLSLKRLPVLVRNFLSRYYEDYYIYLFDKQDFLSLADVIKRSRINSFPSVLVKCSSYY